MAQKKVEIKKLGLKTKDLSQENIEKISKLFPEIITEVEKEEEIIKTINLDKLKELIGDYATDEEETYHLNWVGKRDSKRKIAELITKTLRPVIKDSVDFEITKNLYLEGDNFEVLKLLKESYLNSIKMIYIDPPYNTGKDFVYKDNFKMSKEEYDEETKAVDDEGNKLFKNTTTNGRFHSDWLCMMYERLKVAYDLLKDDGVIFISIDDNEVANLRKICDEIFGEWNFIAILPTIMNLKGNNDQFGFAGTHEYSIVYLKNREIGKFGNFAIDEEVIFGEWEEDEKGYFKKGANLKSTGANAPRRRRPNLFYPIYVNSETKEISIEDKGKNFIKILPMTNGEEMSWRWSKNKVKMQNEDIIVTNSNGEISFYKKQRPQLGDLPTKKPKSIFYKPEYSSGNGTNELNKLLGVSFGNDIRPKPIELIKDFIQIGMNSNDLILDFFSGSATTAHAVMQLNAEDGGERKFIMVQLPEETDKDSEAYKEGYKNICEIGKERIRRAAKKIKEDLKEKNKQTKLSEEKLNVDKLDFGFKVFRLDSSNMKDVYYNPNLIDQRTLTNYKDNIKEDRSSEDLLYQVLLDLAIPISSRVRNEKINNKKVFVVETDSGENWLVACFDEGVNQDFIKEIVELKPLRIVFRDSSFKNDADKVNCEEYLKHKLPNTQMRVI